MTAAERDSLEKTRRNREHRIRVLLEERRQVTMQFMQASRNFKMSVRGSTVLHVVRPGSRGADVTTKLQEALKRTVPDRPHVVTASSVDEAKRAIESSMADIRVIVIEADIDYPGEGILLAKWVKTEHPELPLMLATENESDISIINEEIPFVDVFYSRAISTSQLIQLFGCTADHSDGVVSE